MNDFGVAGLAEVESGVQLSHAFLRQRCRKAAQEVLPLVVRPIGSLQPGGGDLTVDPLLGLLFDLAENW